MPKGRMKVKGAIYMFQDWKRRFLQITAAVAVAAGSFSFAPPLNADAAGGSCGEKAKWDLANGTLTISGSGAVTTSSWRSNSSDIQKIVVKDGITSLPNNAFYSISNAVSAEIADSVTSFGTSTFSNCLSLKSVHISDNLSVLPKDTFNFCVSLTDFNYPSKLVNIEARAFYACISMAEINVPSGVKTLGDSAYSGNNSHTVQLPDGLESIGKSCFDFCCFEKAVIPDSVTSIGAGAFSTIYASVRNSGSTIKGFTYSKVDVVTIYGKSGSTAEAFAAAEGLHFKRTDVPEHECAGEVVVKTPATCEKDGAGYYVCDVCGEQYDVVIPATGHSFGDWYVTKEPTVSGTGQEEHKCSACGKVETREIAKLEGFAITASAGDGGSISPSGTTVVEKGKNQTYTFTPNAGYAVSDVVVDGKSCGAMKEYTFTAVTAAHTITVQFAKIITAECTGIHVDVLTPYWEPTASSFAKDAFCVKAVIVDNGTTSEVDITADCVAVDTPSAVNKAGGYGETAIQLRYQGTNEAVKKYAEAHGIQAVAVIAKRGDANYDGVINEKDAIIAIKAYSYLLIHMEVPFSASQLAVADVFRDGSVDSNDGSAILRYYATTMLGETPTWENILKR